MDGIDLPYFGTIEVKRTQHLAVVGKGLQTFEDGPLTEQDVDVGMWRYHVHSERHYVANLVTGDELKVWRGRYMVHGDELC